MFTNLFLKIKNLPHWLRDLKSTYPFYLHQIKITSLFVLLSVMHFFSFRNDYVYLFMMLIAPLFLGIYQSFLNFSMMVPKVNASKIALGMQGFPIWSYLVLMVLNVPMIIFSHNVFGVDTYDEYFFLLIAAFLMILLHILSKVIRPKRRGLWLVLLYTIAFSIATFMYIYAVTI